MLRTLRTNLWFLTFILLTGSGTITGQDDKATAELQNVDRLVELLYSIEDFQVRFGNALENDAVFADYSHDAYFVKTLTETVGTSAVNEYGESIGRAALKLSQAEVDSLIAALQSPYGNAIRKLFVLDNSDVERELGQYVNAVVEDALVSLQFRDSMLFEKEYPFDLKEIMNGTYDNFFAPGKLIKVERTYSSQQETLNEQVFNFKIAWVNNSKYTLTTLAENASGSTIEVVTNIYAIEGQSYKYISRYPDGSYEKHELIRTGFESYPDEVKAFRWSLHDKYADAFTSPLNETEIEDFKSRGGHKFYALSEDFKVTAQVERESDDTKTITMVTSNEQERVYRVYGKASFEIDGKQLALNLYEPLKQAGPEKDWRLFLPFRDLTSGEISYGGGRYIDIKIPSGDQVVIDFNKTYNPYCAYTDGYSCPIPPEENTLDFAIGAGIKAPKLK